jgi:TolB-like protein
MSGNPNKLSRFWQELKRRNVIRMITVYAGVAFVIIELINNITEPLRLPEWSPTLVIVLLAIGFPIVIIFSWIYDIHPEGGMVKTEPSDQLKEKEVPKSSNGWRIASYISFVVIVGLIVLNIIARTNREKRYENMEKSIAVLPFKNMSINEEEDYIGGAFTDEIIMELQKIKAFDRVLSRTSTLQYEEERPAVPEIAEKLNVNYIIEGSIQRVEGRVRINVQVIRAVNEDHIWVKSYDEDYTKPEDILDIQSRIALSVADELKAVITPEERKLIDKIPTSSLSALNYYQRGKEEYTSFLFKPIHNREALQNAHEYFKKALEYDATYANAYAGLAMVAYSKLVCLGFYGPTFYDGYLERHAFDSVFYWVNQALHYDDQLDEAYLIRGKYYYETGERGKAEEDFQRAISLNPNQWEAYFAIGRMTYFDVVKTIENYRKALTLTRGSEYQYIFYSLGTTYYFAGFSEMAQRLWEDYSTHQEMDSLTYYVLSGMVEPVNDTDIAAEYLYKAYAIDSTNPTHLFFAGERMIAAGHSIEGLKHLRRYSELCKRYGIIPHNTTHRIGYYLSLSGYQQEAAYFLDKQEEVCRRLIELDRPYAQSDIAQFDLAITYAFIGKQDKAIAQLKMIRNKPFVHLMITGFIFTDPMLDSIRNDPEFQEIANDLSIKYQAEHERIRQWLEENDML